MIHNEISDLSVFIFKVINPDTLKNKLHFLKIQYIFKYMENIRKKKF